MEEVLTGSGAATERTLDVRGLRCPMPIVKAKKALATLGDDEVLRVVATDRGSLLDFLGWIRQNPGYTLSQSEERDEDGREIYVHRIARKP